MEITYVNQKENYIGVRPGRVPKHPVWKELLRIVISKLYLLLAVVHPVVRLDTSGVPSTETPHIENSSGVYICKSVVNDLKHGN